MHFEFDEYRSKLSLRGKLTGETDFKQVAPRLDGQVAVDLSGVERINSAGVLAWLAFVRSLPERVQLRLERCSVSFVEQLNLLSSLGRGVEVISVLAPYLCPGCGTIREDELQVDALLREGPPVPAPCHRCGEPMELDTLPEMYFAFTRE